MPSVVISFSDGEVLHAETPELTFDQQVLEAEPRSVEPNTERALFPLTAIRMMVVGEPRAGPDETVVGGWDRAAFHFTDGHVLRASIQPDDVHLGRHDEELAAQLPRLPQGGRALAGILDDVDDVAEVHDVGR